MDWLDIGDIMEGDRYDVELAEEFGVILGDSEKGVALAVIAHRHYDEGGLSIEGVVGNDN